MLCLISDCEVCNVPLFSAAIPDLYSMIRILGSNFVVNYILSNQSLAHGGHEN